MRRGGGRVMMSGADVAGSRRAFETTDRFRERVLRQPRHSVRDDDGEGDEGKEDDVDRQRRAQRL
jgi:hypothetical protein